jgi:hypothetical protein
MDLEAVPAAPPAPGSAAAADLPRPRRQSAVLAQAVIKAQTPDAQRAKRAADAAAALAEKIAMRQVPRPAPAQKATRRNFQSPSKSSPPITSQGLIEWIMSIRTSQLIDRIWPGEVDKWQADARAKAEAAAAKAGKVLRPSWKPPTSRNVVEGAQAGPQCNATIGEFKPGQPCYICGFPIQNKIGAPGAISGLTPECEHILPVAQVILLYDMFHPADAKTAKQRIELATEKPIEERAAALEDAIAANAADKEFFSREYRWAHEICNQVKTNDNIISYKAGTFILDKQKLEALLRSIYDSNEAGHVELKGLIDTKYGGFELWKNQRVSEAGVIKDVQPLLDRLNTLMKEGGVKMFALTSAATILGKLTNKRFGEIVPAVAASQAFAVPPPPLPPGPMAEEEKEEEPGDKRKRGESDDGAADILRGLKNARTGGKRRKTYRMRRCRLPKLL